MSVPVAGPARRFAALVEALLTPHGTDRYLELVHPMLVRREIRGEVVDVRHQTDRSVTLTVRPSRAWPGFTAGQFVRVSVDINGVRHTRCYSPACSQHGRDGLIEFTVHAHQDGTVSRHLHAEAAPGMVLGLAAPEGTFTLPTRRPERILLVSGGSGITPVLSMFRTLADEGYTGEVVLLHYATDADHVPYRAELARPRSGARTVFAYTAADGGELRGHLTRAHLDHAAPWWRDAETYVCGPATLMDSVRTLFEAEGLGEHVHTERFTPPVVTVDADAVGGTIRFARSDREFENSGRPLLDQAEDAGLTPEFGCRMGICHSCTKVKTSGRVRNAGSGELSDEENEEIQLCVSVPVGDVEINA